jgi:pantoate--beta-alanine ligase
MWIAKTKAELRARVDAAPHPIILVPTMGALHEGHASLITLAREKAGGVGTVVVSIFVNPIQFDREGDLAAYPRPLTDDLAVCETRGADGVFIPEDGEMYFPDRSVTVTENSLSQHLCGAARPGHFDGVCTVVLKLFLLTRCDAAVFGEKDFQQLAVIRRMVRDLDLRTEIIPHPTMRESDGLAMSSRNARLTPEHRTDAPRLRRALLAAAVENDAASILRTAREIIDGSPFTKIDYLSLVDAETLIPTEDLSNPAILACAVFYGEVRLIDHIAVGSTWSCPQASSISGKPV